MLSHNRLLRIHCDLVTVAHQMNFFFSFSLFFSFCRCCNYISLLERVNFSNEVGDQSSHISTPNSQRVNSDIPSPMSESSSISDYLSGELSPNGSGVVRQNSVTDSEHQPSNSGLLTPGDASRAIYALSAAVDRLFEHAANTLHLEGLLSFLDALVHASRTQLFGAVADKGPSSPGGFSGSSLIPSYSTTLHLYRLADVILRSARNTNRPLLHLMRAWTVISPHFVEVLGTIYAFLVNKTLFFTLVYQ